MMPDRSRPAKFISLGQHPNKPESQDLALPRASAPDAEPGALPSGFASRPADPAEADRRQMAEQIEGQIIAPLKLLLAQAAAFEQTLAAHPPSRTAVSVL